MQYAEYLSLEKRLGILGECHIYTPKESAFADWVVLGYDIIAVSGLPPSWRPNTCCFQQ